MRKFPFRVDVPLYTPAQVTVLDYRNPGNDVRSTPMPTIDNRVVTASRDFRVNGVPLAEREATINIHYRLFNDTQNEGSFQIMRFRIIYQPRLLHHMYRGGAPVLNTTGANEPMGETSWEWDGNTPRIFMSLTVTENVNWLE